MNATPIRPAVPNATTEPRCEREPEFRVMIGDGENAPAVVVDECREHAEQLIAEAEVRGYAVTAWVL